MSNNDLSHLQNNIRPLDTSGSGGAGGTLPQRIQRTVDQSLLALSAVPMNTSRMGVGAVSRYAGAGRDASSVAKDVGGRALAPLSVLKMQPKNVVLASVLKALKPLQALTPLKNG